MGPSGEGEFQVTGRARPKVSRQAEAWWLRGQKESLVRLMVRTRGFGLYSLQRWEFWMDLRPLRKSPVTDRHGFVQSACLSVALPYHRRP